MKRVLIMCLAVLMMAGCAKEEKTVKRAVFAWEGVEKADKQLLENYRINTIFMGIKNRLRRQGEISAVFTQNDSGSCITS